MLAAALASNAWAHSEHKQENKPQISLPEVLASVNGADIPKTAVLRQLERAIGNYKKKGMPLTADQEKSAAKKLLQDEIGRVLLLQKAKEIGAEVSDNELEKKLDEVKSRFKSDAVFEHKLSDQGMTLDQYRSELKVDLTMDKVIKQEIEPGIQIGPEEIKAYYEKNKDKFMAPDKVRAGVILIKVPRDATPRGIKRGREKLESIREQILNGADFAALAKRFSQDSLASKGGDLGFFSKQQMFGAFSSRAFEMEVGEVSEVFQTGHGLHLLKVTDKKSGGASPLEQVKGKIRKTLAGQKIKQATRDYIEGLKKKVDIKTYF
ncbi:MAG: peptidylprolyl isomerase [Nitrospinaceae bacterium]